VPVTVTHRIWLRWRDDLVGGMRLRKGARLFVIRAFRDPDEAGRYALCDCEEIRP
jgi:SPP1 family predicted phage head-tail adaptor